MKNIFLKLILLSVLAVYSSCTVYDNPAPFFEESDNIESPAQRKVLFISIDGLVGRELGKNVPANLKGLMDKGKYTFNSFSDIESGTASTWTSMMTGVNSSVHHIEDETFRAVADPNDQHAAIAFTPTFFYRLFSTRPEYNTTVISSWEPLVNNLLVEVETQILTDSDLITRDSAVSQLSKEDPEIMIVNFRDVLEAGKESGFTIDNDTYSQAVNKIDEYVGDIMNALKSRKNYEKEEWMVIVTSNQGGSPDGSFGTTSFEDRNTFTILHYKGFSGQEIDPSLIGSSQFLQLQKKGADYIPNVMKAEDATQYDFRGEEMTFEFKLKRNFRHPWVGQPFILGKTAREHHAGSGRGWGVGTEDNKLKLYITFDDDVKHELFFGADIDNYKWHHFAFSLKKVASNQVKVTLYADGLTSNTKTITTTGSVQGTMSSTGPLFIGVRASHNWDVLSMEDLNIADFRILNKAIESNEASRLSCFINGMPNTDALFANQIGFFPLDKINGTIVENEIQGKTHLKSQIQGGAILSKSLITTKCNEDDRSNILISNQDMTTMILYWLRITPEISWKLGGARIIDNFESEFANITK